MSLDKNQKELKSVLKRYLDEKTSQEETDAVNNWYEELGRENHEISHLNQPDAVNDLGKSIKKHLIQKVLKQKKTSFRSSYFKYAAILVLLIGAGLGIFHQLNTVEPVLADIIFRSGNKTAKEITLKDGSKVLLNVGSELIVNKDFGVHERNVTLSGEAFFKISKNRHKPFIIKSGLLKTTVIGTSFNINAYPDLERIKIAVASGKVMVTKKTVTGDVVIAGGMTKNTTLTFDKQTGNTSIKTEDTGLISSWKDSKLYIDNLTISEIAKQLERYYHLKVIISNEVNNNRRYTIRFDREPANRVMEILSILTKTKFTYQTNLITIK